jgi:hypothetical protein
VIVALPYEPRIYVIGSTGHICNGISKVPGLTLDKDNFSLDWAFSAIGPHHPLDGITSSEYKLLRFIQLTKIFAKRRRH